MYLKTATETKQNWDNVFVIPRIFVSPVIISGNLIEHTFGVNNRDEEGEETAEVCKVIIVGKKNQNLTETVEVQI